MFDIDVNTDDLQQRITETRARLTDARVFFQTVVRPSLLQAFAEAYGESGLGIQSGRLYDSYVNLSSRDHVSEISPHRIVEGTRVPYAVYLENRNPIVGRIARNQQRIAEYTRQLGEFIVGRDS